MKKKKDLLIRIEMNDYDLELFNSHDKDYNHYDFDEDDFNEISINKILEIDSKKYKVVNFKLLFDERWNEIIIYVKEIK